MAAIRHPETGILIGDPDRVPLQNEDPDRSSLALDTALEKMILSASGWRAVFAPDGDEESAAPEILPAYAAIAAAAAAVFASYLKSKSAKAAPTVVVGLDSRPTGPAIADVMIRAFLASGCAVRYAFIVAAPEIMAYARSSGALPPEDDGHVDGFAYISASHNPVGHNGFKFGLIDGGVLAGPESALLTEAFRNRMADPKRLRGAALLMDEADPKTLAAVYTRTHLVKRASHSAYLLFTREVVAGTARLQDQDRIFDRIAQGMAVWPLGILADFNGSARTRALDTDYLSALGVTVRTMNDRPGAIAHRIVPEGESLEPCRLRLQELHAADPSFVMGYVPDCDGDRGNLVCWDDRIASARALEAQEVFALCCVSELAHLVWTGALRYDLKGNALDKVAVAVNDPTSMRVDRIAAAFDVSVFRAEVGEANVVGLARKLRERGYQVRILGEGAAGGNITHPSAVRDPIDTVSALVKLLTIRSDETKPGLFELWCDLSDQPEAYHRDFTLTDVIATLPSFTTTSVYVPEALLQVQTGDHGLLKARYQDIFKREWESRKKELADRYGLHTWEAIAYTGMDEHRNIAHFSAAGRGGLKILFHDSDGHAAAYIWMRGSGTEPVFRIMADTAGSDRRQERDLLAWQRNMVQEADAIGAQK